MKIMEAGSLASRLTSEGGVVPVAVRLVVFFIRSFSSCYRLCCRHLGLLLAFLDILAFTATTLAFSTTILAVTMVTAVAARWL